MRSVPRVDRESVHPAKHDDFVANGRSSGALAASLLNVGEEHLVRPRPYIETRDATRDPVYCPPMSTRLPIVGVLYRLMIAAFLLPAAVPAQETTGSLEGRVLDERREPLAQAHVLVAGPALQ